MSDDGGGGGEMHALQWSPTRAALTTALLEVQRAQPRFRKDKRDVSVRDANNNPVEYTSLGGMLDALEPLLSERGLVITSGARGVSPRAIVVTVELSLAGTEEWVRTSCLVMMSEKVPRPDAKMIEGSGKALGAAITAGRRHLLAALVNAVAGEGGGGIPPHPAESGEGGEREPRGRGDSGATQPAGPRTNGHTQRGPADVARLFSDVERIVPDLVVEMREVLGRHRVKDPSKVPAQDAHTIFVDLWRQVGERYKAAKETAR